MDSANAAPCSRRSVLAGLLAAGLAGAGDRPAGAEPARAPEPPTAIDVRTRPLSGFEIRDSSRRQFGALEFRGGLVLSSSSGRFGGISGLQVQPDGARFVAITDRGWWFRGRLIYDGERPAGIADAEWRR